MSNSRGISKTKLPYATNSTDLTEAFNYLVKTLNSSFFDSESPNYVRISKEWTIAGTAASLTFTLDHGLGKIPIGWVILDMSMNKTPLSPDKIILVRTAWTTTQITVTLILSFSSAGPFSGSFTIAVLG